MPENSKPKLPRIIVELPSIGLGALGATGAAAMMNGVQVLTSPKAWLFIALVGGVGAGLGSSRFLFLINNVVVSVPFWWPKSRVSRVPGARIAGWAESILTRKFYKRVVEPLISDFQHEYFEALDRKRVGRARWLQFLLYISFGMIIFAQAGVSIGQLFAKLWKAAGS